MKSQIKWILIVLFFSVLSFWIGIQWERFWSSPVEFAEPYYSMQRVYFSGKNQPLYLKSKTWGLLGNHTATVISNKPDLEFHPDSTFDYIFSGVDNLLYEKQADTLLVYHTYKPHIPDRFYSEINVKLVELDIHKWRALRDKAVDGIQIFH